MSIQREILIYSNLPFKKYRWVSYYSIAYVGFLTLNTLVIPNERLLEEVSKKKGEKAKIINGDGPTDSGNYERDSKSFWQKVRALDYGEIFSLNNIYRNISERPYLCLSLYGASALVTTAFVFYAHRTAHLIKLVPPNRVQFSSFAVFGLGKPPTIEVPLTNVSCVAGRDSNHNYSILKFKGYYGYHLVHKQEGQFAEPELYDEHLGYARSWARKD